MSQTYDDPEEVTVYELTQWLIKHGYAEALEGYGHVSAATLAEALLSHYTMYEGEGPPA